MLLRLSMDSRQTVAGVRAQWGSIESAPPKSPLCRNPGCYIYLCSFRSTPLRRRGVGRWDGASASESFVCSFLIFRSMNNSPTPVIVVVSFTTSPTRLHKCWPVIDSLLNQTHNRTRYYSTSRRAFDRTGEEYPPDESLPNWLIGNSLVKIRRCDRDWGPATKIVPTVLQLQKQSQRSIVISVDDDIRYPSGASALQRRPCHAQSVTTSTKFGASRGL